jgi:hypothetical protein
MHSVMRNNLLPQSRTIQEQNSLWVIVTLSLSLSGCKDWEQQRTALVRNPLQFDSEQAIILYGGGGRSRQPIATATTSSFLWSSIHEIILCRDYCHPPENRSTILACVLRGYYYYKVQRLDLTKAHSRGTTHICAILILSPHLQVKDR